jgi:hypothetical protein
MEKEETTWEVKDRHYYLLNNMSPLTYTMNSKHTTKSPLLYFDEGKGSQRALRYATNQSSPFVDEQEGGVTLEHIVFEDGVLFVPRHKQNLQKLLSLYHPLRNLKYAEHDNVMAAVSELEDLELEIEALNAARVIDIDHAEAILRVEIGSKVSSMDSKEIKRDILIFAKRNPKLFIDLANDENVTLRNFAIRATELSIIRLAADQRTFKWGTNGRKLMSVPFDENPYSAMAAWFKTDEGLEVYKSIEKKLS